MQYKDYYKILGVEKNATEDQIKSAFRKLAKKFHPDTNQGNKKAEERFKEINEAYEVLGDKVKRDKYDNMGSEMNFANGADFDPSRFGAGFNKGFGGFTRQYSSSGTGQTDFSDFFRMFFGADYNEYRQDGEDIESIIDITPEEGLNGAQKVVTLSDADESRTISFKIPKGIKEGGRIKLKGQGGKAINGGIPGDLYLKIKFKNEGKYELQGEKLIMPVYVTPWEAALGSETEVQTADGKLLVKIPPGIQTDKMIRLPGRGYPVNKNQNGDLYLKIKIINPDRLSKQENELYQKLRQVSTFKPANV